MPTVHELQEVVPLSTTLECAARFVARSGLPTTVLVLRRPGIAPAARALADSCGLTVRVELNRLTTAVRFSRSPMILN
jgi:hypothetical protein